jgi:hypothetical protein
MRALQTDRRHRHGDRRWRAVAAADRWPRDRQRRPEQRDVPRQRRHRPRRRVATPQPTRVTGLPGRAPGAARPASDRRHALQQLQRDFPNTVLFPLKQPEITDLERVGYLPASSPGWWRAGAGHRHPRLGHLGPPTPSGPSPSSRHSALRAARSPRRWRGKPPASPWCLPGRGRRVDLSVPTNASPELHTRAPRPRR